MRLMRRPRTKASMTSLTHPISLRVEVAVTNLIVSSNPFSWEQVLIFLPSMHRIQQKCSLWRALCQHRGSWQLWNSLALSIWSRSPGSSGSGYGQRWVETDQFMHHLVPNQLMATWGKLFYACFDTPAEQRHQASLSYSFLHLVYIASVSAQKLLLCMHMCYCVQILASFPDFQTLYKYWPRSQTSTIWYHIVQVCWNAERPCRTSPASVTCLGTRLHALHKDNNLCMLNENF